MLARYQDFSHRRFFHLILSLSLVLLVVPLQRVHAQTGWVQSAGGPEDDIGYGVTVDASGNIYVTGEFEESADFDGDGTPDVSGGDDEVFLAKYDANGDLLWVRGAGGADNDSGYGVAVDASGGVYVVGELGEDADFDGDGTPDITSMKYAEAFLAKYSATGNLIWVRNAGATGRGFAVDNPGNIYVTGDFEDEVDFDGDGTPDVIDPDYSGAFLVKYDENGKLVWVITANGTSGSDTIESSSVAVDDSGNGFIAGFFYGRYDFDGDGVADITSDSDSNAFLASFNEDGDLRWVRSVSGSLDEVATGVAVDVAGNSYVTGGYYSADVDFDGDGVPEFNNTRAFSARFYLAKYDPNGDLIWVRNTDGVSNEVGAGVALDGSGNIYAAGSVHGITDFNGDGTPDVVGDPDVHIPVLFVAKYNPSGDLLVVQNTGYTALSTFAESALAVDASGNSFVTGSYRGKLDVDGDGIGDLGFDFDGDGTDDVTPAGGYDVFLAHFPASPAGLNEVTVATGQTGTLSLGASGAALQFTANGDPDGGRILFSRSDNPPPNEAFEGSATAPDGTTVIPNAVAGRYWEISDIDLTDITFHIRLSLAEVEGITNSDRLLILKREDSDAPWQALNTTREDDVLVSEELTSFSEFSIGSNAETNPLPVELASFEATLDGADVLLSWQTASETNNAGFEVEMKRGPEGTFARHGFVEGRGTTAEVQQYSYRIADLAPGHYAFRLKQVDLDGASSYSSEVEVQVLLAEPYVLSATYPNPFSHQAQFTLAAGQAQHVELSVYNVLGQRVALVHEGALEANEAQRFTLGAQGLPNGVYFLRVKGEHFEETRRIVVVK